MDKRKILRGVHNTNGTPTKTRRPRPQCGDVVYITSTSGVYLTHNSVCDKKYNSKPLTNGDNCHYYRSTPIVFAKIRETFGDNEDQQISCFIGIDVEGDHHYETLYSAEREVSTDEYDSFESDIDSDISVIDLPTFKDDIGNQQLPDPPIEATSSYTLTRLANSAGKHMQRLRRNWSLTKNDLTKSLSRMAKKKNENSTETTNRKFYSSGVYRKPETQSQSSRISPPKITHTSSTVTSEFLPVENDKDNLSSNFVKNRSAKDKSPLFKRTSQDPIYTSQSETYKTSEKAGGYLSRKKYWSLTSKFKRSKSLSAGEMAVTERTDFTLKEKPNSTFYLDDSIDKIISTEQCDLPQPLSKETSRSSIAVSEKILGPAKRPQEPPPEPPDAAGSHTSSQVSKINQKTPKRSTSWYAESGVFKDEKLTTLKTSNTCWYAEIGLYENNNVENVASHIGDNNCAVELRKHDTTSINKQDTESNSNVNNIEQYSDEMQKRLQDEPLYQFYNAAVIDEGMRLMCSNSVWKENCDDSDGYEQVGLMSLNISNSRPSAMQLIQPSNLGHVRTLWCEVPEVIQSHILDTLNTRQKKLQEAKFELLASEASYLNSLNVLYNHFIIKLEQDTSISDQERNILFGNVKPVKECSEQLLADLEACWQDNILLHGICDIVKLHALEKFGVYITYCENQIFLEQLLKKIKDHRSSFIDLVSQLESSPICQSLPLHSFLMLPMQRITRFPLLVDAILKRLLPTDDEFDTCQLALSALSKVVSDCNDGARRVAQQEEYLTLWSQLEFSETVPRPISSCEGRTLIRSGEVTQLIYRNDDVKHTFGRKFSKSILHIFLFTDILLVTKNKSKENAYTVLHHCPRSYIDVNSEDVLKSLPTKDFTGKHMLFLTLLENHHGKTIELLLSCASETDQQRWIEAFSPPTSHDPNETLYESWDCPQVAALHAYHAQQPDELSLDVGDVVNVNRKMTDGWYYGQKIRDGRNGWFPGNHVTEVASPHIRARNLKQRYRLLALSGNYLEAQKNIKV